MRIIPIQLGGTLTIITLAIRQADYIAQQMSARAI